MKTVGQAIERVRAIQNHPGNGITRDTLERAERLLRAFGDANVPMPAIYPTTPEEGEIQFEWFGDETGEWNLTEVRVL